MMSRYEPSAAAFCECGELIPPGGERPCRACLDAVIDSLDKPKPEAQDFAARLRAALVAEFGEPPCIR